MNFETLAQLNADDFYSNTVESIEFTELPETSFIQFVRHLHNLGMVKYINVWQMIVSQELNRSFSEGHDYCKSRLEITPGPNGFRRWWYITTSGTVLQVIKLNSEDKSTCGVALPLSRKDGYTANILNLYVNNPNLKFFSDWEMRDSVPGTPEYFAAKTRGITPTAEKTWEQMSTHEKRTVDRDRYLAERSAHDVKEDLEEYEYDDEE
jgi:hypothetical protein